MLSLNYYKFFKLISRFVYQQLLKFGNFRALVFCEKNHGSKIPKVSLIDEDYETIAMVNRDLQGYILMLEKGKLREGTEFLVCYGIKKIYLNLTLQTLQAFVLTGIRHILSIARIGNQVLQANQPWVLCKGTDDDKKRCETIIGLCLNLSCLLAQLLDPFMPETSNIIRKQLNCSPEVNFIDDKFRLTLPPGHKIGKVRSFINKLEIYRNTSFTGIKLYSYVINYNFCIF